MKEPVKVDYAILFYLAVSILGLGLLVILAFNQAIPETDFAWQKPVTGVIFSAICILGITAGLSPRQCSRATHFKATAKSPVVSQKPFEGEKILTTFRGHHPTCGHFNDHVLSFSNRKFCAGCTGLVFGAVLSVAGSVLYFFASFPIGEFSAIFFGLGFFGVICGLLQYELPVNNGFLHFLINTTLVLGTFLLLVEVNVARESFMLNLYLLLLSVYWVLTRIKLSRIEHRRKCLNCSSKPCDFSFIN